MDTIIRGAADGRLLVRLGSVDPCWLTGVGF